MKSCDLMRLPIERKEKIGEGRGGEGRRGKN